MLREDEKQLLAPIANDAILARVEQWAGVPSGSDDLDGLAQVADMLAEAFAGLPGTVERIAPAPVTMVRADGSEQARQTGAHLVVTVRPHAPVQLLFTGHMDTVFGPGHSFTQLRWIEDGVLNGPGVTDMKGGIAVMLAALEAIEASPHAPGIGYQVMINSDEEIGSPSSAALIQSLAAGKDAALTYEPALPDGTLAGARGGSGNFSVIVKGRSAHAGRNPEEGRNALVAAAEIAVRLKAESGKGFTCNPAKIDGGGPNNVVPELAILRVNFRPRLPEDQKAAQALLDRVVAQVAGAHDVAIHVHGGFGRPPKPVDSKAEALFALVGECGADLGLTIGRRDTGGVCDGNNIAACGVPVIDTMGVRGGAIHSAEEYLIVESLSERAALSALTIKRFAERKRA